MSCRIVAIRPEPGCAATVSAGAAAGLEIEGFPLFEIRPVTWELPPADSFDGVLLGSANVLRHGGPQLAELRGRPAWCVGEATAEAARAAGLEIAGVGQGGLQDLLDRSIADAAPRLLRLAGREHVSLNLPPAISVITRIVYESVALPMPEALAARLRGGALVLLHSGMAARHLAAECDRLDLPRAAIALAALGSRIAAAAGDGWQGVQSALVPSEEALLSLARDMCQ